MMKNIVIILFFLQTYTLFGQVENLCFEHVEAYSYGISREISFKDSTFKYEYVEGLLWGTVYGKYTISGDTITINSDFQEDDYKITKSFDSTINKNSINLKIKLLNYNYLDIDVRSKYSKDSLCIYKRKLDSTLNSLDTIIVSYDIPHTAKNIYELEIKHWRKNSLIYIILDEINNTYIVDLTSYPNEIDYAFFKNQKFIFKKGNLYFLNENGKYDKEHYFKKSLKGIKISKRKVKKKFIQCAR